MFVDILMIFSRIVILFFITVCTRFFAWLLKKFNTCDKISYIKEVSCQFVGFSVKILRFNYVILVNDTSYIGYGVIIHEKIERYK